MHGATFSVHMHTHGKSSCLLYCLPFADIF